MALKNGDPFYFTGKPCIHGHVSIRDAKDRKCRECELIFVRKRVHRTEYKKKYLAWSRANKEKRSESKKRSVAKHREKVRARMANWYAKNREIVAQKRKIWCAANKPKIYASNAARRAAELLATPPWVSAYQSELEAIYFERLRVDAQTGVKHHVDHIYPLKGKNSCGLHVPWNLRIIPASENIRKKNKEPDQNIITSQMTNGLNQKCVGFANSAARAV